MRSGETKSRPISLLAIRHEAHAGKAQDHHGPCGGLGDRCDEGASPKSLSTCASDDQTVRCIGISSATVRNRIKDVERPGRGRKCYAEAVERVHATWKQDVVPRESAERRIWLIWIVE